MKIVMYDEENPFNTDRTVPVFLRSSHEFTRKYPDNSDEYYDVALIHAEMDHDMSWINADTVVLFDCEDQTDLPPMGLAYESLKENTKYYAKLAYRKGSPHPDGMQYICLPMRYALNAQAHCHENAPGFSYRYATPVFFGTGTAIGDYTVKYPDHPPVNEFLNCDGIKCLIEVETGTGPVAIYNQRIDWIHTLQQNCYFYVGGLVEGALGNITLDWQKQHFGEVDCLFEPAVNRHTLIQAMYMSRIHLCPAGMGRWTSRLFDAAAINGVIVATDLHDYELLHIPPARITIRDAENIAMVLNHIRPQLMDIAEDQEINQEYIRLLSIDRMIFDFLDQLGY